MLSGLVVANALMYLGPSRLRHVRVPLRRPGGHAITDFLHLFFCHGHGIAQPPRRNTGEPTVGARHRSPGLDPGATARPGPTSPDQVRGRLFETPRFARLPRMTVNV